MVDVSNYPTHKQTYEPIASTTLGSDTATITFSSLSGTFTDFIVTGLLISARTSSQDIPIVQFNSDTGSNYSSTYLDGNNSGASSVRYTSTTSIYCPFVPDANSTANPSGILGPWTLQVMSATSSSVYKTVLASAAHPVSSATYNRVTQTVGLWRSTSAITSITVGMLSANIKSGSSLALYGIAG